MNQPFAFGKCIKVHRPRTAKQFTVIGQHVDPAVPAQVYNTDNEHMAWRVYRTWRDDLRHVEHGAEALLYRHKDGSMREEFESEDGTVYLVRYIDSDVLAESATDPMRDTSEFDPVRVDSRSMARVLMSLRIRYPDTFAMLVEEADMGATVLQVAQYAEQVVGNIHKVPRVLVTVEGGCVDVLTADRDCEVIVIDKDIPDQYHYVIQGDGPERFEHFLEEEMKEIEPEEDDNDVTDES